MKIYQVNSTTFGSDVQLTYNHNGCLVGYQVMNNDIAGIPKGVNIRLQLNEEEFLQQMKAHNMKVTEVDRNITFEIFYERYAYKVDKSLAEAEWNKLTKVDQLAAFDFVPKYYAQLKLNGGLGKKYPVRYLKHKPWVQ